jgi:ribosomal protein L32
VQQKEDGMPSEATLAKPAESRFPGVCPSCGKERLDPGTVCPSCGAPPIAALDRGETRQQQEEGVRTEDLEPYVTLRYIARMFKVLAILMVIMLIGEVVVGLMRDGTAAVTTLLGEVTRLLVLAGLLWGGGDITVLLIDAGHDVRVARILLGRINAQLHRNNENEKR